MYSRASWGGSIDPFISTTFDNSSADIAKDTTVSFVVFEWRDENLLGALNPQAKDRAVGH